MSGEEVSETTLDTAMNELIATGEIAEDLSQAAGEGSLSPEDAQKVEELIAFIKAKVAAGELNTDEDVRNAIEEGQKQFDVTLSDEEIQKIIDVMSKIRALGLDPGVLVGQAEDLYGKFGTDFVNHMTAEEIGKEVAGSAVKGFFSNIGTSIKNFFSGLFG